MHIIISGTNRVGSNTLKVAKEYHRILSEKGVESKIFSLEGVNLLQRDAAFEAIEKEILIPNNTFIFIAPEYNGSFPGALKLLFDTGKTHELWWHKKAMLTGVASGRAGNLRGLDHLSAVLNHIKITVYPNQLPLSSVDKLLDENGRFTDDATIQAINNQLDGFLNWC